MSGMKKGTVSQEPADGKRQCTKCGVRKEVEYFYKRTGGGLFAQCKACVLSKYIKKPKADPEPGTKSCVRCKESKPVIAFGINRNRKDGLHYYCKVCVSNYKKDELRKRHLIEGTVSQEPADGKRQCTKCGVRKEVEYFYKRTGGGLCAQCKACVLKYKADKYIKKPKAEKSHGRIESDNKRCSTCGTTKPISQFTSWKNNGRTIYKNPCKECRNASVINKEAKQRSDHNGVVKMKDRYIKQVITSKGGIKYSDVPEWMVSMKRVQLEAYRMSRKLRRAINETSEDTA